MTGFWCLRRGFLPRTGGFSITHRSGQRRNSFIMGE